MLPGWESAQRRQDNRHAARVALGLLGPGVILLLVGRPELMLYAVFGSFTGMYGRLEAPRERLWHQFHGAGMLVTGVALGVTLSESHAVSAVLLICVTAFATIGSIVTDRLRLRPGGPFFGIFALGATATVSPDLVSPWIALAICTATAVFCLFLGLATTLVSGDAETLRVTPSLPGMLSGRGILPTGSGAQAARYALATAAAGLGGLLLGIDHANWAMAAAAVPLAVIASGEPLDIRAVRHRAVHRLTGTFAGLLVTALVLMPNPSPGMLAAAVMVLLFPTELFMARHYGVALGFFTPLIMIMTELADPADPITMLVARGIDTVIGVVAGVAAVSLIAGPKGLSRQERGQAWAA
jgi:uncharacterized membrane protein YccC